MKNVENLKDPRDVVTSVPKLLRWLTYVFVVSTVFDKFTFRFIGTSDNFAQLSGVLLTAGFVLVRLPRVRFKQADLKWYLVFFLTTALGELVRFLVLDADSFAYSFRMYSSYLQVFLMFIILRDFSKDPRVFKGIVATFVVAYSSAAVMATLGISQFAKVKGERVAVEGINFNAFAFALSLIVVGVVTWVLSKWPNLGWKGWSILLSLAVLFPAIARTGSRGGALTLIVGLMMAGFVNLRQKNVPFYILFGPMALAGAVYLLLSSGSVMGRLSATISGEDFGSRDVLARVALNEFKKSPVVGRGAGYTRDVGAIMGHDSFGAHNTYLQMLVSFGFLGFVPFLIAWFSTLRECWRFREIPWGGICFAVVVMTFSFGMTGHLAYRKLFWIILAVAGNVQTMAFVATFTREKVRLGVSRWTVVPQSKGVAGPVHAGRFSAGNSPAVPT